MKYDFPMVCFVVLERLQRAALHWFDGVYTKMLFVSQGVVSGKGTCVHGQAIIRTRRCGEIRMGSSVIFVSRVNENLVGLVNPTIIDTRSGGNVVIGDDSGFSSVVISSRSSVTIGNRVKCGGNVRIFDHDFHSLDPIVRRGYEDRLHVRTKPIVIGDDVFVGTNAIILKGTRIGDRSIVAAGSVLFGLDIPADSLVKGNPAQVVARKERR